MALIWKKGYFIFFIYQESVTKNSFSSYLNHIHTCILLTLLTLFCLTNFEKNKQIRIYQVWFHFGMIPGGDSYSRHFKTINK